jgi:predicted deacetylase
VPHDRKTLAVALHDIEPATFERCAESRAWLEDRGVDRATLLVIPARDLHPLGERSPELAAWLAERRRAGDSIAQHGFQHERLRHTSWSQRLRAPVRARRAAEFAGLDGEETRRAVEAGWRLMKLAGVEPDGFVAPAYAYTPALRRALDARFRWWASLMGLHGALVAGDATGGERSWRRLAPAWSVSTEGAFKGVLSPATIRTGARLAGSTFRLDLHPSDLQHSRQRLALERALTHVTCRRTAATYEELACAVQGSAGAEEPAGTPQVRRVAAERSEQLAL